MRTNGRRAGALCLALALCAALAPAAGQERSVGKPAQLKAIELKEPDGQILSYRHNTGSTEVYMRGTGIEPDASIKLKVESRPGFLELDINRGDITGLKPARRFGKDFLTYVMWAVSVDGKASNLGEITFDGDRPISINVTTPYQTFWLMVTAEPDYAVADPSPLVVLYSINQDTSTERADKKALPVPGKLLFYTHYTDYRTAPGVVERLPNELLQARKAVELASQSGILAVEHPAGTPAVEEEQRTRNTLAQARSFLDQAESAYQSSPGGSDVVQFARTAAQIAENARALALGAVGGVFIRQLESELAKIRKEAEDLHGEVARMNEEVAPLRAEAERLHRENTDLNSRLAAAQQELSELHQKVTQLEAALEAERQRSEAALAQQQQATREASDRAQAAEAQLAELNRQLGAMSVELDGARNRISQLSTERDTLCGELQRQLSSLGQLTDQGGSMVLTLASDILFDSGSYELKPVARENLSKLAVLRLLLFPDAEVRYEGHTDLVGEEGYNQWLSEQRALSVYRYFLEEASAHEEGVEARAAASSRLVDVRRLLDMSFAASTRSAADRSALLEGLGGVVSGQGERAPVVQTESAEERNRRVVLHFPPAQVGQLSTVCGGAGQQSSE